MSADDDVKSVEVKLEFSIPKNVDAEAFAERMFYKLGNDDSDLYFSINGYEGRDL